MRLKFLQRYYTSWLNIFYLYLKLVSIPPPPPPPPPINNSVLFDFLWITNTLIHTVVVKFQLCFNPIRRARHRYVVVHVLWLNLHGGPTEMSLFQTVLHDWCNRDGGMCYVTQGDVTRNTSGSTMRDHLTA